MASLKYAAPRLQAYLPRGMGRPVLVAPKDEWDRLELRTGDQILVDIEQTPLSPVSSQATILACVATQYSTSSGRLSVYREDPQDAPDIVNADHYEVWRDLRSHASFDQMVVAASTNMNDNMRGYLDDHIFLVKLPPEDDHHSGTLPKTVTALFTSSNSTV